MSDSIKEQINSLLDDLNSNNNIEASAVVTRDGLLIAEKMSNALDTNVLAAMTATMLAAAETAIVELDVGNVSKMIVESANVKIICLGAGEKAILILTVTPDAEIEGIYESISATKDKIESVLESYVKKPEEASDLEVSILE